MTDEGPSCTNGKSYRARAEARQRRYRAGVLDVDHGRYGHFLSNEAADAGRNFILDEAFLTARARQQAGKGVAQRTFDNMLSSQAMCFNLFALLATRLELATEVLLPFIDGLLSAPSAPQTPRLSSTLMRCSRTRSAASRLSFRVGRPRWPHATPTSDSIGSFLRLRS